MDSDLRLLWKSVLGEIEVNTDPSTYVTWFKKTKLVRQNKEEIIVSVPNAFAQKQLETRFRPLIEKAFIKNNLSAENLRYRVLNTSSPAEDLKDESKQSFPSSLPWNKPDINLNPKYTFDSFIPGSGNDLAYAAAQAVVGSLGKKYNPLFLYGGVGIGKTHLIQAIGNKILENNSQQFTVVYRTIEQFVQDFTNAIRYKKISDFTKHYRNVDVLIIDDIQFIATKEKTQEEFFHTFNVLHESGKQIIISSDKPPSSIPTLRERLQNRFQMGLMLDMQTPDFETRLAILKAKAEASDYKIEDDCLEFLATNISTNIRDLEGALNQLNAFCEAHEVPLATKQIARKIFQQYHQNNKPKKPSSKQIIERVSRHYQVSVDSLTGSRRNQEIVLPRQIAMYLLRNELHLSFPQVAKILGRKDHTTAMHSIDKIEDRLSYDDALKNDLYQIRDDLKLKNKV